MISQRKKREGKMTKNAVYAFHCSFITGYTYFYQMPKNFYKIKYFFQALARSIDDCCVRYINDVMQTHKSPSITGMASMVPLPIVMLTSDDWKNGINGSRFPL